MRKNCKKPKTTNTPSAPKTTRLSAVKLPDLSMGGGRFAEEAKEFIRLLEVHAQDTISIKKITLRMERSPNEKNEYEHKMFTTGTIRKFEVNGAREEIDKKKLALIKEDLGVCNLKILESQEKLIELIKRNEAPVVEKRMAQRVIEIMPSRFFHYDGTQDDCAKKMAQWIYDTLDLQETVVKKEIEEIEKAHAGILASLAAKENKKKIEKEVGEKDKEFNEIIKRIRERGVSRTERAINLEGTSEAPNPAQGNPAQDNQQDTRATGRTTPQQPTRTLGDEILDDIGALDNLGKDANRNEVQFPPSEDDTIGDPRWPAREPKKKKSAAQLVKDKTSNAEGSSTGRLTTKPDEAARITSNAQMIEDDALDPLTGLTADESMTCIEIGCEIPQIDSLTLRRFQEDSEMRNTYVEKLIDNAFKLKARKTYESLRASQKKD